jgi:MtN3 and saliva related transmembrane protein
MPGTRRRLVSRGVTEPRALLGRDDRVLVTSIGLVAAALTSLSYVPQVRKVLAGQSTDDLSLQALIALTAGLVLWAIYGLIKPDMVVLVANGVGRNAYDGRAGPSAGANLLVRSAAFL